MLMGSGALPPFRPFRCHDRPVGLFGCAVNSKFRQQFVAYRPREVCREMPECEADHVAVVSTLLARLACQVKPEAMDQINIVIGEVRRVRSQIKILRRAVSL